MQGCGVGEVILQDVDDDATSVMVEVPRWRGERWSREAQLLGRSPLPCVVILYLYSCGSSMAEAKVFCMQS